MSDAALAAEPRATITNDTIRPRRPPFARWFLHALPFLILGIGAIVGMAATTVTGEPKRFYWSVYTPVAALICVIEGWRLAGSFGNYSTVLFKQIAQWLAVGVAMYLLMLSPVRGLMNDDAVGLTLLTFIALSVFVAGINMVAWRLLVMGAFLACTVAAISFVEAYAIVLMALVFAGVCLGGLAFWFLRK